MTKTPSSALSALKVIDLSRVLGGPYCTQILGDHGADVIKVEPPGGDETRGWGPPFKEETASYFIGVNRNKRGIVLDLTRAEGRQVLLALLEDADVLVENFKTGTMEKWGLGYVETLKERFPRLVHCRISGFGADGPLGGRPGYDAVVQAMTGLMSINGEAEQTPLRLGAPIVDLGTGLYAVVGILMALAERERSGRGQFVEVALYDAALALLHPHAANFFLSGKAPQRTGNAHPNIAPYDSFQPGPRRSSSPSGTIASSRESAQPLDVPSLPRTRAFAPTRNGAPIARPCAPSWRRHWPGSMAKRSPSSSSPMACRAGPCAMCPKRWIIRIHGTGGWWSRLRAIAAPARRSSSRARRGNCVGCRRPLARRAAACWRRPVTAVPRSSG